MTLFKIKKLFIKIVKYYNNGGRKLMKKNEKYNFKLLYNFWKQIKKDTKHNNNIYTIKEYHSFINNSYFDKNSSGLWDKYIISCQKYRINDMKTLFDCLKI
jgi:hypothetical protein